MDEELYIRMINGRPVDHPMLRSNIESAFPEVDFDNLPDWLMRFERVEKPQAGVYEIVNGPVYTIDGNVVKDQWILRAMTEEEKLLKQTRARSFFAADNMSGTRSTWVFDEKGCCFVPPVPYPADGGAYDWSDAGQTWVPVAPKETPEIIEGPGGIQRKPYPIVGGTWRWDEAQFDWIKVSDDAPPSGVLNVPLPPGVEAP